jgi:hypothetical protein
MSRATDERARRARVLARALAVLLALATAAVACAEQRHAAGEECLKDVDCLSGICVSQRCGEPGATFDSAPPPTAPPADAASDAGSSSDADAASEVDADAADR